MRRTFAALALACSPAAAGGDRPDALPPEPSARGGLPLLSIEGGAADSWDVDVIVENQFPLSIAGTRVSTVSDETVTGDTADDASSIRVIADFSGGQPRLIDDTFANWSMIGQLRFDQLFCGGCVESATGTARFDGSGRLEIRLREWVLGRYRWGLQEMPVNGAHMAPASITGAFWRETAAGPGPSFAETLPFFSNEHAFAPGLYVVEFDVTASADVNYNWASSSPDRVLSYSILASLAVDEIMDPPPEYDRDGDLVMTPNDLCLFLADPTDLTGDGEIDQLDADEFLMTLEVILGDLPDADGDGVPDDCDDDCTADLAEPFGVLDFSDVVAFLTAFGAMDAAADLASPFGSFDFSDVVAFLSAFGAGCP